MRIAHLSDPHILDLDGVGRSRLLLNKRATGWINLKLHRGSIHRRHVVEAMMDDIRAGHIDHVVITGDISNLALESEFDRARTVFARLGMTPEQISIIPGNHDVYTRGAERSRRFAQFFAPHITSDLPLNDSANHPSGPFPFVRLRGEAAIIGLSSAVARLPIVASGHIGKKQLTALSTALAHPELKHRTPIVLLHHPIINPRKFFRTLTHGLSEGKVMGELLHSRRETLFLHGHLHERAHRLMETGAGSTIHHFGATSASLVHPVHDRLSSYNVYTIGREGLESVTARVWDAASDSFVEGGVTKMHANFAH